MLTVVFKTKENDFEVPESCILFEFSLSILKTAVAVFFKN